MTPGHRCKYCGSNDWQELGWNPSHVDYEWFCRYCEKITRVTQAEMAAVKYFYGR